MMIIHQRDGSFRASYDVTKEIATIGGFYAALLVLMCTQSILIHATHMFFQLIAFFFFFWTFLFAFFR